MNYRMTIRKNTNLSQKDFNHLIQTFYTYYMDKPNDISKIIHVFENGGRFQDGAIDLYIHILMNSSLSKTYTMERVPMLYKLLTSLTITPYLAVKTIHKYMQNKTMLKDVVVRVLKHDSEGNLQHLKAYANTPELTSMFPSHDYTEIIILLK